MRFQMVVPAAATATAAAAAAAATATAATAAAVAAFAAGICKTSSNLLGQHETLSEYKTFFVQILSILFDQPFLNSMPHAKVTQPFHMYDFVSDVHR